MVVSHSCTRQATLSKSLAFPLMFKVCVFLIPLKNCMDKVVRLSKKISTGIREKQEADLMFERIADELPDVLQNTLDKEIGCLSTIIR